MTQITQPNNQDPYGLFYYLFENFVVSPTREQINELEKIVLESEVGQLAILEAIQSYLLEHGGNDEDLNDDVFVLKGLKTREEVDKLKIEKRKPGGISL